MFMQWHIVHIYLYIYIHTFKRSITILLTTEKLARTPHYYYKMITNICFTHLFVSIHLVYISINARSEWLRCLLGRIITSTLVLFFSRYKQLGFCREDSSSWCQNRVIIIGLLLWYTTTVVQRWVLFCFYTATYTANIVCIMYMNIWIFADICQDNSHHASPDRGSCCNAHPADVLHELVARGFVVPYYVVSVNVCVFQGISDLRHRMCIRLGLGIW